MVRCMREVGSYSYDILIGQLFHLAQLVNVTLGIALISQVPVKEKGWLHVLGHQVDSEPQALIWI